VSDSPSELWWTFIAGVLAVAILLVALGAAIVIYQRRYVNLHRDHARHLLEAQEEERAWVAREVHDDALQRIALIRGEFDGVMAVSPALSEDQADRLAAVQQEMQDLSVLLRGLAHRLHPALIDRGGLHAALAGLSGEAERAYGIRVETHVPDGPIPIDPHRALALYRIAQEALRNVAAHAGVADATLECRSTAEGIELTVSDRGEGFDPRLERTASGLGLIGMKERAHLAGGSLVITARPGRGTTVRATFPA
jgi:signal transduction histidine kinase